MFGLSTELITKDKLTTVKSGADVKNWTKTVASDLNQYKKPELCCDVKGKEKFVRTCRR